MRYLDARKEDILDFIVRDFIRTANPVSSGRINEKRAVSGSPATIRNIMLELDEGGYLHQLHASAGRAPTDKGYRYFVDNLMLVREPAHEIRQELDRIIERMEIEMDSAFSELSRTLASHLKLFSGVGRLNEERIFGHGLSEVLKEPEFDERDMAVRFADFAENIHSNIKNFSGPEAEVDANGFGLVSMVFRDSDLGECVMFSAGPQRMNYEKAVSVLKYTAKDISAKGGSASGGKNKKKTWKKIKL